jgi:hypothetical protein
MIQIKVGNDYLDTSGVSFTLKLVSPIFHDSDGSHTYNFTLPGTDKNKKILSFPARVERSVNTVPDFDCEVYINGTIFLRGLMKVVTPAANSIEVCIGVNKGEWNYVCKNLMLPDVNYGDTEWYLWTKNNDPDSILKVCESFYPDVNFAYFPFRNTALFQDTVYATDWLTASAGGHVNNWLWASNAYMAGNGIAPQPYLCHVIAKIFESAGFYLDHNSFFVNEELRKLVVFNNNLAFNIFSSSSYQGQAYNAFPVSLKNHVPDLNVGDFFRALKNQFNAAVFVNGVTRSSKLLFIEEVLRDDDTLSFSEPGHYDIQVIPETRKKFILKTSNGSDEKIQESIKNDIDRYERVADVQFEYNLPIINQSDLICYVTYEDAFYISVYDPNTGFHGWNQYTQNILDKEVYPEYEEEEVIETDSGFPLQIDTYNPNTLTFNWEIPICKIKGNMEHHKLTYQAEFNEVPLKLLFYRGMYRMPQYPPSVETLYPLGTAFNYASHRPSTAIPGAEYSLRWDTEFGLYEKFWRMWLYWKNNLAKPVKITKLLTEKDIAVLDFSKKYWIDNAKYLLAEITLTVTERGIKPAEIYAYKV